MMRKKLINEDENFDMKNDLKKKDNEERESLPHSGTLTIDWRQKSLVVSCIL